MEKIVNDQVSRWFEMHNLLPDNQHGFRKKRSTMTATASMQQEWVNNTDEKFITGILFWDLSAAYDTLDPELICSKLKIYGFNEITVAWFRSFLVGRKQSVRIGEAQSEPKDLSTGVPQGGILSPILFTIVIADMNAWVKYSESCIA